MAARLGLPAIPSAAESVAVARDLALAEHTPTFVADPVETAAVLTVPVRHFLPDAPVEIVDEERGGWTLRYGAYPVAGYRVWGATGRVLAQLGAVLGPETA